MTARRARAARLRLWAAPAVTRSRGADAHPRGGGAAAPSGKVDVRGALGRGSAAEPGGAWQPAVARRRRRRRGSTVLVALCVMGCLAVPAAASPSGPPPATASPGRVEPPTAGSGEESGPSEPTAEDVAEAARVAAEQTAVRRLHESELELARTRSALRTARMWLDSAEAAGRAADGRVRGAEETLPPLVLRRRVLSQDLAATERHLEQALAARTAARAELVTARDALSRQALQTFKTGSAAELTGPVAVLREARDPGQLARGLADLRAVTRDGARSVRAIEDELLALERAITELRHRRDRLADELATATAAVTSGEEAAANARSAANAQEARVVAAMEAELAADEAVRRAGQRRDARRAELALLTGSADVGGPDTHATARGAADGDDGRPRDHEDVAEAADRDARAKAVLGRRRAYQRAERLTASQRRTTDAWACPVAGARFVNDWAFPRSGARRHEGTDVFASMGTPIHAVADGTVTVLDAVDGPGDLGGITVTITEGRARQYYAHLERIDPVLRRDDRVRAGDRLGWVGASGNARGTPPHLHLGWYVDDVAVNPYASLAVACDGRREPAKDTDVVPTDDGIDAPTPSPTPVAAGDPHDQGWRTPSPARIAR